jgi:hypothetical protein
MYSIAYKTFYMRHVLHFQCIGLPSHPHCCVGAQQHTDTMCTGADGALWQREDHLAGCPCWPQDCGRHARHSSIWQPACNHKLLAAAHGLRGAIWCVLLHILPQQYTLLHDRCVSDVPSVTASKMLRRMLVHDLFCGWCYWARKPVCNDIYNLSRDPVSSGKTQSYVCCQSLKHWCFGYNRHSHCQTA